MAIRIREINGVIVALCAAKTTPRVGDTYLDDNIHHALSTKFAVDFENEGLLPDPPVDEDIKSLMLAEEMSRNA